MRSAATLPRSPGLLTASGALSAVMLVAGVAGCQSIDERLQDAVQYALESDPNNGSQLCGFPVQGLTSVEVTDVTHTGSRRSGSGTATVTGVPVPYPGMSASPGTCSGTITFDYAANRSTSGGARHRRRRITLYVYNVRVTRRTGTATATTLMQPMMPMMPMMPSQPVSPGFAVPIQLGTVIHGALQMGDMVLPTGTLADDYSIMLTAGVPVTIVVRGGPQTMPPSSSTLDVYTVLLQNGVELAHDDDGAGYPNSRIVFTPPATGMYTIRVTTFGSGMRQGMYTLQTMPGANPTAR